MIRSYNTNLIKTHLSRARVITVIVILAILMHIHGCAYGKERVMDIGLRTEVVSPVIISGGPIKVRLTLTNKGSKPLEIPSLEGNNDITNYQLEDKDGKLIGIFNHVSRQVLLEFQRVRHGEHEMKQLAPGESEIRDYNFLLMHWLDSPGKYRMRGLYKWQDIEILSEPAEFEIVPANVAAHDQQWCYNYGEKYYLHTAAVFEHENKHHLILRQSHRFSPTVVDFNHNVYTQDSAFEPLVSFNRAFMAESLAWITWLSGSNLLCLRTDFGQTSNSPFTLDTRLSEAQIISPPVLNGNRSLTVVIRGKAKDGADGVLMVKINDSGKELKRLFLPQVNGQGLLMRCLMDETGGVHLVWVDEKDGNSGISILQLDTDAGSALGKAAKLWDTGKSVLALVTPSLLREKDMSIYFVTQDRKTKNKVTLARVFADGSEKPIEMKRIHLDIKDDITQCSGEVDEKGDVHCAFLTKRGDLFYLNFMNEKLSKVAQKIGDKAPSLLHLFVNDRNDVFVGYNLPGKGLEWKLIEREEE